MKFNMKGKDGYSHISHSKLVKQYATKQKLVAVPKPKPKTFGFKK